MHNLIPCFVSVTIAVLSVSAPVPAVVGMQISEDDFYLRGKEPKDVTIKTKRAVTLKQYKDTIKSNHPDVYEKYNVEEMLCA